MSYVNLSTTIGEFQCRSRNYQQDRRRLGRALRTEWVCHLPQTEGRKIESHLVSSREEFREGVDFSLDAANWRASEQGDDNQRLAMAYRSNTDGSNLGVNRNCKIERSRNLNLCRFLSINLGTASTKSQQIKNGCRNYI